MDRTQTFIIPGKVFKDSLFYLKKELSFLIHRGDLSFAIKTIFEFIALTESNKTLETKLKKRGEFLPQGNSLYKNKGRSIYSRIRDLGQHLEGISIYIPRTLKLKAKVDENSLFFVPESTRIILTFDNPPIPGVSNRYIFESLQASNEKWIYELHNDFNESEKIQIIVDLSLDVNRKVVRKYNHFTGSRLSVELSENKYSKTKFLVQSSSCFCCPPINNTRRCEDSGGVKSLTIRPIVILNDGETLPTFLPDINSQIEGIQEVLNNTLIIPNILDTVGFIDPAFSIIDVSPCTSAEVSIDTRNLFSRYSYLFSGDEVVAFFVPQVIGATGCASHPINQRGFVMARRTNNDDYVGMHELGHVLGLTHIDDETNLMNPTHPFSDPPPDLTADQIKRMRCESWLKTH